LAELSDLSPAVLMIAPFCKSSPIKTVH
jgi:hypothetical protein